MSTNTPVPAEKKKMPKGCGIAFAVFILIVILYNLGSSDRKDVPVTTTQNAISSGSNAVETKEELPAVIENWSYGEQVDKMTDKTMYFASCQSTNKVEFDFPYDGGSSLSITVRNMNGANEVILQISKGQFMSSYSSAVKIKFDDEAIKSYNFTEPSDNSNDYIFLNSGPSIIKKLRTAKKLKIQPQFFQEGQTVFEFDVAGLKWER